MKALANFNDFTKGDPGRVLKDKVQPGYFLGENVMVYPNGTVGPRSALRPLAPTGLPGGTVYNIGYIDMATTTTEYVWLHIGTNAYRIPVYNATGKFLTAQAAVAMAGAFAATPASANQSDYVDYDPSVTFLTIRGDKTYKIDHSSGANGTITALAGSPGGRCIETYREFLVVAGTTTNPNRIWFSKAGDFTTWPAANFFDVGPSGVAGKSTIVAIKRLRDALLVWNKMGQLFVITGRLGTNQVVREFMPGDQVSGPGNPSSIIRSREGAAWWSRWEAAVNLAEPDYLFASGADYTNPSAVPIAYTGGQRLEMPDAGGYLIGGPATAPGNRESLTHGVTGRNEKSIIMFDQQRRALVIRDGAVTRHCFDLTDIVVNGAGHTMSCAGSRGELYLMPVSSSGARIAAFLFEFDRPPFKARASATDLLPWADEEAIVGSYDDRVWFATPMQHAVAGMMFDVKRIEVTFTNFFTGSALNNHIDVFLQQYDSLANNEQLNPSAQPPDKDDVAGVLQDGGVTVGCTTSFDEADPNTNPFRRRVDFFVAGDNRPCESFRVMLTNLRGVAIRSIVVFGDVVEMPRP